MDYNFEDSPLYSLVLKGRLLKFPKGQVVSAFEDKAHVYLIKSGFVKRYLITKEGNKGVQVIFGPNDIMPLTPIYKTLFNMNVYNGPEQYYYEAMTPLQLAFINQETFLEGINNNPQIYKDLLYAAGLRLNSYIQRLESMSKRAANRKIANQLAYFADVYGEKTDRGMLIKVPLTHQNIADILNLARETVTHCMVRLEEKGLIYNNKQITVIDVGKLRDSSF